MIRTVLCLLFAATIGSNALCQQRHFGRIDGEPVSIVLSADQLSQTPDWSSDDQDEPPLSVGKAIAKAKIAVAKKFPKFKDKNWTVSVILAEEHTSINTDHHFTDSDGTEYCADVARLTFTLQKWVYWVRLTWHPLVGNGLTDHVAPNIPVAVLMDGTVVLPTKITKPIPEAEFAGRYRRIQSPNH